MTVSPQYIAGLFDGEGSVCISLSKHVRRSGNTYQRHSLLVSIVNTHLGILQQVQSQFGGAVHARLASKGKVVSSRQCWAWQVGAYKAREFLAAIQPYAVIKSEQVSIALEFQNLLDSRLREFGQKRWPGSCKTNGAKQVSDSEIAAREKLRLKMRTLNSSNQYVSAP